MRVGALTRLTNAAALSPRRLTPSLAAVLAASHADGGDVLAFSGLDMSAFVRHGSTPANNFGGDANGLFSYISPSNQWIRNAAGLLVLGNTLRPEHDMSGNPLGLWVQSARTSLAAKPRRLDDGSYWTHSNTAASAVVGQDGVSGSATRIIATGAGNGTVIGTPNTSASAARRLAPFVKRAAGTGDLEWTLDGGSTWTAFAGITSSWQRIGVGATVANPRVGFRVVSSGDEFDIDFANGETGTTDTSPIDTESGATGTVTRAADNIRLATSKFNVGTERTIYWHGQLLQESQELMGLIGASGFNEAHPMYDAGVLVLYSRTSNVVDGDVVTAAGWSPLAETKVAVRWALDDAQSASDGALRASDNSVVPCSPTSLRLHNIGYQSSENNKYIKGLMILPTGKANAALQAMTGP